MIRSDFSPLVAFTLQVGRSNPFLEGSYENDWESISCPEKPGHQRAGSRIGMLSIDLLSTRVVDIASTLLSNIVITDKALSAFSDAGLTGFSVQPVRISSIPVTSEEFIIPTLWEFVVGGSAGPAHWRSGINLLHVCKACGLTRYSAFKRGIHVDPQNYDGSDFFTVIEYPAYVMVSTRAKQVIETSRLTNIHFVESKELVWPETVARPARP
jgi:hypothetical protein